jgi:5-methylcytosine-specific restriction endonuclease McrA
VRAEAQPSKPNPRHITHASSDAPTGKARATASAVRAERKSSKPNTRHIAHALRRQVYARDAGRCRFVSPDGTRCGARGNLEFHHIIPFARGGEATLDNICLMCRAHNEKRFGVAHPRPVHDAAWFATQNRG